MLLPQDQILDSEEDNFLHNALEGKLAKVDDTTDYLSVLLPSKLAIDIMAHISPRLLSLEDSFADLCCTCSAPPPAPPPAPAPPAPKPPVPRPPKAKPAVPALAKPTPAKAMPPPPAKPSFASVTQTPTRPSLIISAVHPTEGAASPAVRHSLAAICSHLNATLAQSPHQVTLSAVQWTAKNNLVVVAGPDTTAPQLASASHFLSTALGAFLSHDPNSPLSVTARENVRWSRLTINGLPTGASTVRGAFTPTECHVSLLTDNPMYQSLWLTQPPSWTRDPRELIPSSPSWAVDVYPIGSVYHRVFLYHNERVAKPYGYIYIVDHPSWRTIVPLDEPPVDVPQEEDLHAFIALNGDLAPHPAEYPDSITNRLFYKSFRIAVSTEA
ncbi:hypothetical protein EDB86DRAFT_3079408 [Lactarius hatsudake]|nr:hypothetical protein EDB86DRAFT_3079408 [Lactarius hatsudake]